MFFRLLDPIIRPFRQLRSRWIYVRSIKGRVKGDVNRVKSYGRYGVQSAKGAVSQAKQKGQAARQKFGGVQQMGAQQMGAAQMRAGPPGPAVAGVGAAHAGGRQAVNQPYGMGTPGQPGMAGGGMPGQPPGMGGPGLGGPGMGSPMGGPMMGMPRGRIKRCGFLWLKKKCADCQNPMEKGWDICPYCNAAAAPPEPGPAPAPSGAKTQAFMLDAAGGGVNSNMALLGWLVPLRGPQRGELFTLAPETMIGTDPTCTVVLSDNYMSQRHAEIKAEGGQWVLKDLGSTNGTFVNDKRVDRHELVDSDFIKFGQSLVKFKCL